MTAQDNFQTELQTAQQFVKSELSDLTEPLLGLVKSQMDSSPPPLLAAIALATGFASPDSPPIREKRLFFAAAIEMLRLAIDIHQLIISMANDDETTLNTAFIGGTILAGDYCFSRAASLVTRTDSPEVVAIFAQALKNVSEAHLRHLFDDKIRDAAAQGGTVDSYDKTTELCKMSAKAAAKLAHLSPQDEEAAIQCAITLANQQDALNTAIHHCATFQQTRWHQVAELRSNA